MRIFARLTPFIAALLLIGCAQGPQHAGGPYAPDGGGYAVNMPGSPKESADGAAHMAQSTYDEKFYMVRYKELEGPVNESGPQAQHMLDRAAQTWASDDGRHLVWEKKAKIDGHPARDLLVRSKDGPYMRIRLAITSTRFYQVIAVTDSDDKQAARVAPFINSFHFTAK